MTTDVTIASPPMRGTLFDTMSFAGQRIELVFQDGRPLVVARRLAEIFGLAWGRQSVMLQDPENGFNCSPVRTVGADGKSREMLCLSPGDALFWLQAIRAKQVNPAGRALLVTFQRGFLPALWDHATRRLEERVARAEFLYQKLKIEALKRKPLWGQIERAMAMGWGFEQIAANVSPSRPKIAQAISEMLDLRLIEAPPAGTPLDRPLPAPAQLALFQEG